MRNRKTSDKRPRNGERGYFWHIPCEVVGVGRSVAHVRFGGRRRPVVMKREEFDGGYRRPS